MEVSVAEHPLKVPVENLRSVCDPSQFDFETTEQVTRPTDTVGQPRATSALEFGLGARAAGYNIYAAGLPGTGRLTTVQAYTRRIAATQKTPDDWCYVNNFGDPYRPTAIDLPAGKGTEFARDVDELIEAARREIPRTFESENYEQRRTEIRREFDAKHDQLIEQLDRDAAKQGLAVQITPVGILIAPLNEGRPMTHEQFQVLPEKVKKQIREKGEKLQTTVTQTLRQIRRLERELEERYRHLDREVAVFAIGHLVEELRERYQAYPKVIGYINQLQNDIVEHLDDFCERDK